MARVCRFRHCSRWSLQSPRKRPTRFAIRSAIESRIVPNREARRRSPNRVAPNNKRVNIYTFEYTHGSHGHTASHAQRQRKAALAKTPAIFTAQLLLQFCPARPRASLPASGRDPTTLYRTAESSNRSGADFAESPNRELRSHDSARFDQLCVTVGGAGCRDRSAVPRAAALISARASVGMTELSSTRKREARLSKPFQGKAIEEGIATAPLTVLLALH